MEDLGSQGEISDGPDGWKLTSDSQKLGRIKWGCAEHGSIGVGR